MVGQEAACIAATQNSPFAAVSAISSASVAILEVQNRRNQQLGFDFADDMLKLTPRTTGRAADSAHVGGKTVTEILLAEIAAFCGHNNAKYTARLEPSDLRNCFQKLVVFRFLRQYRRIYGDYSRNPGPTTANGQHFVVGDYPYSTSLLQY